MKDFLYNVIRPHKGMSELTSEYKTKCSTTIFFRARNNLHTSAEKYLGP